MHQSAKVSVSHWGKDVDLIFVDTRPCRSASVENICQNDIVPTLPAALRVAFGFPPQPPAGCLAPINDPSREFLETHRSLFALNQSRSQKIREVCFVST